jgi:hypothetical protein
LNLTKTMVGRFVGGVQGQMRIKTTAARLRAQTRKLAVAVANLVMMMLDV